MNASHAQARAGRPLVLGVTEAGLAPLILFVCLVGSAEAFQRICVINQGAALGLFVLVCTEFLRGAWSSRRDPHRTRAVAVLGAIAIAGLNTRVVAGFNLPGVSQVLAVLVGPNLAFLLPAIDAWTRPRSRVVGMLLVAFVASRLVFYLGADGLWWMKVALLPAEIAFTLVCWSGSAQPLVRRLAWVGVGGAGLFMWGAWREWDSCLATDGSFRARPTEYYIFAAMYLFQAITVLRAPTSRAHP